MRLKVLVISPHKADPPRWTEAESHVISPSDEKMPCGFLGNTSRHTGVGKEDNPSRMYMPRSVLKALREFSHLILLAVL